MKIGKRRRSIVSIAEVRGSRKIVYSRSVARNTKRRARSVVRVAPIDKNFDLNETIETSLDLVYKTREGQVLQCDRRGVFYVHFYGEVLELKLCGLLTFRRKVNRTDIGSMLSATGANVELIYLPHCDRLFAFSVLEISALQDLLDGAMAMLHLNSHIHRETVRKPAFLVQAG